MSKASALERGMLSLINGERAERGLDPLRLELRLNEAAEDHSAWMLEADRFSHTGAGGSDPGDRMRDAGFQFTGRWSWAENVAWQSERGAPGLMDDVASLHDALMQSAGHRANILNPDVEVIGIGVERGEYRGYDAVMVTQNFALSGGDYRVDGGAAAPREEAPPAPEPNAAPVVEVENIAIAAGTWTDLAPLVEVTDADGDEPERFEIRDSGGRLSVRIDGRTVDASDGYRFDSADLNAVEIRGEGAGTTETLRLRAWDGEDWSGWDGFTVRETAPENRKPVVAVDDFVLRTGERADLSDQVEIRDPDGDEALYVQLYDPNGTDNFVLPGRGGLDADRGLWVQASTFEQLAVAADERAGSSQLALRVWDGEDVSDWDVFTLSTVEADAILT